MLIKYLPGYRLHYNGEIFILKGSKALPLLDHGCHNCQGDTKRFSDESSRLTPFFPPCIAATQFLCVI